MSLLTIPPIFMSHRVEPSIRETAFCCPHCSAFTTQYWYRLYVVDVDNKHTPIPFVPNFETRDRIFYDRSIPAAQRESFLSRIDRLLTGLVSLHDEENFHHLCVRAENLHLSRCYNCNKIAVWIYDRLLFPSVKSGAVPNTDLPDAIIHDFEEAREIVNASPRGAAALLRLCVQKLCKHLGEKGKNIDDDIAALVKKGLNPLVQQSLDIVRVIGNEAVHPGVIDLKDDQETAFRLFELVNAIADQMISHPKAVASMYAKLPESKRKAIEVRDAKP